MGPLIDAMWPTSKPTCFELPEPHRSRLLKMVDAKARRVCHSCNIDPIRPGIMTAECLRAIGLDGGSGAEITSAGGERQETVANLHRPADHRLPRGIPAS